MGRIYGLQRLMPEVRVVQLGVMPPLAQQRVVRPLLDDVPIAQDDDAVGVADGEQAVGDDD